MSTIDKIEKIVSKLAENVGELAFEIAKLTVDQTLEIKKPEPKPEPKKPKPEKITQGDLLTLVKDIHDLDGSLQIKSLCEQYEVKGLSEIPKKKWGSLHASLQLIKEELTDEIPY